jgi:hypothetical protein
MSPSTGMPINRRLSNSLLAIAELAEDDCFPMAIE